MENPIGMDDLGVPLFLNTHLIPGAKVQPFLYHSAGRSNKKTPENSSTLRIQESIIPANYSWGMIIQTFFFPGAYLPIVNGLLLTRHG